MQNTFTIVTYTHIPKDSMKKSEWYMAPETLYKAHYKTIEVELQPH